MMLADRRWEIGIVASYEIVNNWIRTVMNCVLFFCTILAVKSIMSAAWRFHHDGARGEARARISHFPKVSLAISRCKVTAMDTEKDYDLKPRRNTHNAGLS